MSDKKRPLWKTLEPNVIHLLLHRESCPLGTGKLQNTGQCNVNPKSMTRLHFFTSWLHAGDHKSPFKSSSPWTLLRE